LAQRSGERDCDVQKFRYGQWLSEQLTEDRTPGVLEQQCQVIVVAGKFDRADRPGNIQLEP
jgi:hypothetical protein